MASILAKVLLMIHNFIPTEEKQAAPHKKYLRIQKNAKSMEQVFVTQSPEKALTVTSAFQVDAFKPICPARP